MPRRLPILLKDNEPEALVAAARRDRDKWLLLTMLYSGLRVGELTGLDVPDLDFARLSIFVRLGKGRKDRVVYLPCWLAAELQAWLGGRQMGPVFCSQRKAGRLTTGAVRRLVKRLAG
jgi:integrase/recombinase XerD